MTTPGWYPDPLGPGEAYRWWDGSQWTEHVRPAEPAAQPADQAPAAPPTGAVPAWSQPPGGPVPPPPPPGPPPAPGSGRRLPLIIGGAAVVVLLIAAGIFLATRGGDDEAASSDRTTTTDETDTTESDETTTTEDDSGTTEPAEPDPAGDRISIGVVSYQALGGEWQPLGATVAEVPGANGQVHVTQADTPTPGGTFVASVVIGFLDPQVAYTGPQDLETATLALAQNLVTSSGAYPDGTTGGVTAAEPADVDGHQAFVVRVELQYAVEGLNATGETVQIAVIDTGQLPAVFWGSVPNDAPQLVPEMEAAFASLTVDE